MCCEADESSLPTMMPCLQYQIAHIAAKTKSRADSTLLCTQISHLYSACKADGYAPLAIELDVQKRLTHCIALPTLPS